MAGLNGLSRADRTPHPAGQVGEPEEDLRYQNRRLIGRIEWAHRVKPGGTAETYLPLSQQTMGQRLFSVLRHILKGENHHERTENSLQDLPQ